LGGGTGTGAAPVLARVAKEAGALVLAFVTLPFAFEGSRRQAQAEEGLETLKAAADGVICLPNQKVLALLDENTPAIEAFEIMNNLLAEGVCGIRRLLTAEGLIKIDFADLCRVVRGRHSASAFATAEAQGPGRVRELVDKLLASPLLDGGQALAQADDVLVSILGGPDLTMTEIDRVMEEIRRHSEQAQITLGAAIDPEFKDRLAVTLVASTFGGVIEPRSRRATGAETRPPLTIEAPELAHQLLNPADTHRPRSRFVAPPPELSPEKKEELLAQQTSGGPGRGRRAPRMRQGQLPLEIIAKGRFEKSEPTIYRGQDLDVPTYVRRGVALN
jgi:cell division protein FtsZ